MHFPPGKSLVRTQWYQLTAGKETEKRNGGDFQNYHNVRYMKGPSNKWSVEQTWNLPVSTLLD